MPLGSNALCIHGSQQVKPIIENDVLICWVQSWWPAWQDVAFTQLTVWFVPNRGSVLIHQTLEHQFDLANTDHAQRWSTDILSMIYLWTLFQCGYKYGSIYLQPIFYRGYRFIDMEVYIYNQIYMDICTCARRSQRQGGFVHTQSRAFHNSFG